MRPSQPAPAKWPAGEQHRSDWSFSSNAISCLPLAISRVDAIRTIREQINKGNQLERRRITSRDELHQLQADHFRWSEANQKMLKRIFQSKDVAREYASSSTRSYPCGVPSMDAEITATRREIIIAYERLEEIMRGVTLSLERGLKAKKRTGKISILQATNPFAAELPVTEIPIEDQSRPDSVIQVPSWAPTIRPFIGTLVIHAETSSSDKDLCQFLEQVSVRYSWMNLLRAEDLEASGPVSLGPLLPSFILVAVPDTSASTRSALEATLRMLKPLCARIPAERIAFLGTGLDALKDLTKGSRHIERDESGIWKTILARSFRLAGLQVDLNATV